MTEYDEWIAIKEFKIGPSSDKKDKLMIIVSINEFENKVFFFFLYTRFISKIDFF